MRQGSSHCPVVWLRADGGTTVGLGHVSRCAALSTALRESGFRVRWATRSPREIRRFDPEAQLVVLPGEATVGPLSLAEAKRLAETASGSSWIVVDHYGASDDYLGLLGRGLLTLVLDDHQERRATLRLAPTQPPAPCGLTGPDYLLVRSAFAPSSTPPPREGWVVAFGGADRISATAAALHELRDTGKRLTVLASDAMAQEQGLDELLPAEARRIPWLAAPELARLLESSEGALVSASTLALEALTMSTPTVALEWTDNQVNQARLLRELGVGVATNPREAAQALRRGEASLGRAPEHLDGRGAYRVAQALLARIPPPA